MSSPTFTPLPPPPVSPDYILDELYKDINASLTTVTQKYEEFIKCVSDMEKETDVDKKSLLQRKLNSCRVLIMLKVNSSDAKILEGTKSLNYSKMEPKHMIKLKSQQKMMESMISHMHVLFDEVSQIYAKLSVLQGGMLKTKSKRKSKSKRKPKSKSKK